jgi:hypothetical protein
LLRARGGSGTINPVTGLPEFFLKKLGRSLKKAVKSIGSAIKKVAASPLGKIILTVGLAVALGPAGVGLSMGTAAGVASAGVTLAGGGSIKEALVAGAMGYVGGGGTVMGYNPVSALGGYMSGLAPVGSALNTGLATGIIGAGVGKLSGMSTQDALRMGLTSGAVAGAGQAYQNYNAPAGAPAAGQASTAPAATGAEASVRADGTISAPSIDAVGPTGTAQDYLGGVRVPQNATMQFDPAAGPMANIPSTGIQAPADFRLAPELGLAPPPAAPVGFNAAQTFTPKTSFEPVSYVTRPDVSGLGGGEAAVATPQGGATFDRPAFTPGDFSIGAGRGGTALDTNYGLAPRPVAPVEPASFFDRAVIKGEQVYDKYLSPNRPGLPSDAGMIRRYAPLAAAGTVGAAALGGFKQDPGEEEPLFSPAYTGVDYLRDNPQQFRGGLDTSYRRPDTLPSPVVPTNFSAAIQPMQQAPVYMGQGISGSAPGIAQPYNMAGMYGVPLIYRAKGGEMSRTEFPRKTGPINGPGTGTSDDIPAMLSDGEFVFTAKAVRNAGKGSRRKGAARMYKLMKMLEGGPVKGK